jgi:hypothetical protein
MSQNRTSLEREQLRFFASLASPLQRRGSAGAPKHRNPEKKPAPFGSAGRQSISQICGGLSTASNTG